MLELISSKKVEEEDINLEIIENKTILSQLENEIVGIKEVRGLIAGAQLIKEPTVSASPVSPKKTLNVLISCILGLMLFAMLAFFLEYLERQKKK